MVAVTIAVVSCSLVVYAGWFMLAGYSLSLAELMSRQLGLLATVYVVSRSAFKRAFREWLGTTWKHTTSVVLGISGCEEKRSCALPDTRKRDAGAGERLVVRTAPASRPLRSHEGGPCGIWPPKGVLFALTTVQVVTAAFEPRLWLGASLRDLARLFSFSVWPGGALGEAGSGPGDFASVMEIRREYRYWPTAVLWLVGCVSLAAENLVSLISR